MTIAEKLVSIAERLRFVYDAGREKEHNRFWDVYQKSGSENGAIYYCSFYFYEVKMVALYILLPKLLQQLHSS